MDKPAEGWAKVTHFTEQGFTLNGIIHAGMNDGEEVPTYLVLGVEHIIGFEPIASIAARTALKYPAIKVFPLALGNYDGIADLHVSDVDGKGSSLMHSDPNHPEVFGKWYRRITHDESVQISTFSTWTKTNPDIDLALYDCLVLDTQGNELDILKGMDEYLEGFKFLSIELSEVPIYNGESTAQDVINFLSQRGFIQDSPTFSHDDVFFVRKDIKPVSDRIYYGLG